MNLSLFLSRGNELILARKTQCSVNRCFVAVPAEPESSADAGSAHSELRELLYITRTTTRHGTESQPSEMMLKIVKVSE